MSRVRSWETGDLSGDAGDVGPHVLFADAALAEFEDMQEAECHLARLANESEEPAVGDVAGPHHLVDHEVVPVPAADRLDAFTFDVGEELLVEGPHRGLAGRRPPG
jgi:hypothetical protein